MPPIHPFSVVATFALAMTASCATAMQQPAGRPPPGSSSVVPGVEVLLRDSLHLLRGKRVGLITNHSGRDRRGTSTIDLLYRAPGVRLTALFGPEHGLRGAARAGESVATATDSATGVPIYSLYGQTYAPTPEMLRDVDVLLYDIQDVGARVYTFEWTMALSADAAGRLGKKFIVLDRPDPIRGDVVEGNVLDPRFRSFVGQYPVALRYGLTPGELLRYLVGTGQVSADVTVIPMQGWRRSMWWEETGISWINPSPNLRSVDAAILYPGTVFFEGTNATEGRGTDKPFQLIGAEWLQLLVQDSGRAPDKEVGRVREISVVADGRGVQCVQLGELLVLPERPVQCGRPAALSRPRDAHRNLRGSAGAGGHAVGMVSVLSRQSIQPILSRLLLPLTRLLDPLREQRVDRSVFYGAP